MPTSSQAMILRCRPTDISRLQPAAVSYIPFANVRPTVNDFNVKFNPPSPYGSCERVQFDFSVSANPDRSIDGFEGVFAYDQKTKSYRWQIYSVSPKGRNEFPIDKHNSGDHLSEEPCESDSAILQQSSEYNGHFTTPAESLIDNSCQSDFQTDQETNTQTEDIYRIDETAYRRLEELGFRKRTTYTPGGSLVHVNKETKSPLKMPQRCSSEPLAVKRIPKLSLKNLNKDAVMKPQKLASDDCFKPKAYVCEDSMRRRLQPTKQKSLLDEVKESVNWTNRVTPSIHHRGGFARNIHFAVCFSLRDSWKYDHVQVKDLVESQTQCKVKNLHFDPISLRTADRSVLDRWIVTFTSGRYCAKAIERGLSVGGDKVVVRAWEDIVREEQGEDWCYPCNFRLPSEKHDRVLRKFLQVH